MVDIKATKRECSREWFAQTAHTCTYEDFLLTQCHHCGKRDTCKHSGAFRRMPLTDGGLGLCPNLKK